MGYFDVYFKYGSYQHASNEVLLTSMTKETHFSARRKSTHKTIRMTLQGDFCETTQSAIEDKIDEIYEAYKYHNKDCGLYMDDGTITSHHIDTSQTMGGVRVVNVDFPTGQPGEFATGRTYRIVLEADVIALEDQTLWYTEQITTIGAPGSIWVYIPMRAYQPARQVLVDVALQDIIQRGQGLGFDGYVIPQAPIFPYDPTNPFSVNFEHREKRRVTYGTPQVIERNNWHDYPCAWEYHFTVPDPFGIPNVPRIR